MLCLVLKSISADVINSYNGEDAWTKIMQNKPDLLVLDVTMPQLNGLELLQRIRRQPEFQSVYIIMLTARNSRNDIVSGLESGADDYISKPFELDEFLARIRAGVRRVSAESAAHAVENNIPVHGLYLFENGVTVFADGQRLHLTTIEFSLLELFINNRNSALSREYLLNQVVGFNSETNTRTIDTHINNLRKKLSISQHMSDCIVSVRNIGYRFDPPDSYPVIVQ
jgi:two-component system alkaline phosphatase synthesis response regulator PhoP